MASLSSRRQVVPSAPVRRNAKEVNRSDDSASTAEAALESLEAVVEEMRREPGLFPSSVEMARRLSVRGERVLDLCRQHYHADPGDLLRRARVGSAKSLLAAGGKSLPEVARHAGFENLQEFEEAFRNGNGMSPRAFQKLEATARFRIH